MKQGITESWKEDRHVKKRVRQVRAFLAQTNLWLDHPPFSDYKKLEADYKRLQEKLAFYESGSGGATDSVSDQSAEQKKLLRVAFDLLDGNSTGTLPASSIEDLAFNLGAGLSQEEWADVLEHFGGTDAPVSFDELYDWWIAQQKTIPSKTDSNLSLSMSSSAGTSLIKEHNKKKGGLLSKRRIKKMLRIVEKTLEDEDVQEEQSQQSSSTTATDQVDGITNVDISLSAGSFAQPRTSIVFEYCKDEDKGNTSITPPENLIT